MKMREERDEQIAVCLWMVEREKQAHTKEGGERRGIAKRACTAQEQVCGDRKLSGAGKIEVRSIFF